MRLPSIPLLGFPLAPACLLLAAAPAPAAGQNFDPGDNSCDGKAEDSACWMEIANHPQCYLWSHGLQLTQSVTWSGTCRAGLADGRGTATWTTEIDERIVFETGVMLGGHRRGQWVEVVITGDEGEVTLSKGPYGADGERTGNWIRRWSDSEIGEGTFVDGEWQGGERTVPAQPIPAPISAATSPESPGTEGPICTGDFSPDPCWMAVIGRPSCYLWNPQPQDNETVRWSGGCSNGRAQGVGRTTWYQNHEVSQTVDGRLGGGRSDGWVVGRAYGDDGSVDDEWEGCYADEEQVGTWMQRDREAMQAGRYWRFTRSFSEGERIVVNMMSDLIDSRLRVVRDGTEIASDDDGGAGLNARVEFRVPATGVYEVQASDVDGGSGTFVLWIGDRDPGTTNPGEPCGPR